MIVTSIDVLIRLLIAHILSDFIFQPKKVIHPYFYHIHSNLFSPIQMGTSLVCTCHYSSSLFG